MAGEHVRDGKASYRSQSYITDVKTNVREKKDFTHKSDKRLLKESCYNHCNIPVTTETPGLRYYFTMYGNVHRFVEK